MLNTKFHQQRKYDREFLKGAVSFMTLDLFVPWVPETFLARFPVSVKPLFLNREKSLWTGALFL